MKQHEKFWHGFAVCLTLLGLLIAFLPLLLPLLQPAEKLLIVLGECITCFGIGLDRLTARTKT